MTDWGPSTWREMHKQWYGILIGGPGDGRAFLIPQGTEPRDVVRIPKFAHDPMGLISPDEIPELVMDVGYYEYRRTRIGGLPPSRVSFYVLASSGQFSENQ